MTLRNLASTTGRMKLEFLLTEMSKDEGEQALETDQKFKFGHIKFQILIRYPSIDGEQEIECLSLDFVSNWTSDINLRVASIYRWNLMS